MESDDKIVLEQKGEKENCGSDINQDKFREPIDDEISHTENNSGEFTAAEGDAAVPTDDYAEDATDREPHPPGESEGADPVNSETENKSGQRNIYDNPPESLDALEEEYLVQEMMTGDIKAQEREANADHPVTDTPEDGDMEPPGEEEIEMLEEIPVISIRSRSNSTSSRSSYSSRSRSRSRSKRQTRSRSGSRRRSYSSAGSDIQCIEDDGNGDKDDLGLPTPVAASMESVNNKDRENNGSDNNSDDDILEVEVVNKGSTTNNVSENEGGRKRQRSTSSRSESRLSSGSGHQQSQRRSQEGNSKTSRWGAEKPSSGYVSHSTWSFDTSRPPPNMQQNQWVSRDQRSGGNSRGHGNGRGRGLRLIDDRRNRDWDRGGGPSGIQTGNHQNFRSLPYCDSNQNNPYNQSSSDYSSNYKSQPLGRHSGDDNLYGYNSNSDYYGQASGVGNDYGDHDTGYQDRYGGGDHQYSETYDEQGDRYNYNDGYDSHSFASERDHQQRSAGSTPSSSVSTNVNLRRLSGGQEEDGDQTLRPGNYLLVTWDAEILAGGGLYQLASLSSHGDGLHCVVEQRNREDDLHQAKHHPFFPLVILSGR